MEYLDVIRTLVEIVFFVVTGTAVVAGLRVWRNELRGRAKYEAAKNVIVGAYRIRDAIEDCQSLMMTFGEWADRPRDNSESESESRTLDSWYAYNNRLSMVIDAVKEWYPAVVEAEALFGEEARSLIEKLNSAVKKLRAAIVVHHKMRLQGSGRLEDRRLDNIVYGIHPGMSTDEDADPTFYGDNGFQQDLETAVEGIRQYFTPHIR